MTHEPEMDACSTTRDWLRDADGPLPPALEAHAAACPRCGPAARRLAGAVALSRAATAARRPALPDAARVLAAVDAPTSPSRAWILAAALALLAVVVWRLWSSRGVEGTAPVSAPEATRAVRPPPRADEVVVSDALPVRFEEPGTGRVELSAHSAVEVAAWGRQRTVLRLRGGRLDAAVEHRAPGQLFEIRTDAVTVRVVGTRFSVERLADGSTAVSGFEGLVTVEDPAGRFLAHVRAGDVFRSRPPAALALADGAAPQRGRVVGGSAGGLPAAQAAGRDAASHPTMGVPAAATAGVAPAVAPGAGDAGRPEVAVAPLAQAPGGAAKAAAAPEAPAGPMTAPPAEATAKPAAAQPPEAPAGPITAPPAEAHAKAPAARAPEAPARPVTAQPPEAPAKGAPAQARETPAATPHDGGAPEAPSAERDAAAQEATLRRAEALLAEGHDAEAQAALEQLLAADKAPKGRVLARLGDARRLRGDLHGARRAWEAAAELGLADRERVLPDLTALLGGPLGDLAGAADAWRAYLRDAPTGRLAARAHAALGREADRRGDRDAADREWRAALAAAPAGPDAATAVARVGRQLLATGSLAEADAWFAEHVHARVSAVAEAAWVGRLRVARARGDRQGAAALAAGYHARFPAGSRSAEVDELAR